MKIELEQVLPADIEKRSFEIITEELEAMGKEPDPALDPIIKRVIHTTADFSFADSLYFSPGAVEKALAAIREGASVVTDTNMARAGINKTELLKYGGEVLCFMADADVRDAAKLNGTTRAFESMKKAASLKKPLIFAIGNAPTALVALYELMEQGLLSPALIIAAPVGFVNVVQAKELILSSPAPNITARGRRGGSPVAASIMNALLYMLRDIRAQGNGF